MTAARRLDGRGEVMCRSEPDAGGRRAARQHGESGRVADSRDIHAFAEAAQHGELHVNAVGRTHLGDAQNVRGRADALLECNLRRHQRSQERGARNS